MLFTVMGRTKEFSSGYVGYEVSTEYPNGEIKQAVEKLGSELQVWKSFYPQMVITATCSL